MSEWLGSDPQTTVIGLVILAIQAIRWYLDRREEETRQEVKTLLTTQHDFQQLEVRVSNLQDEVTLLDQSINDLKSKKLPELMSHLKSDIEKFIEREIRHIRELFNLADKE